MWHSHFHDSMEMGTNALFVKPPILTYLAHGWKKEKNILIGNDIK